MATEYQTDMQRLVAMIQRHESLSLIAYPDNGWSIGWGHHGAKPGQTCTKEQADAWLALDIDAAIRGLASRYPDLPQTGARWAALVDMVYQLGLHGFGAWGDMIDALRAEEWHLAAIDSLRGNERIVSRRATQTPLRAIETALMLATGEWGD